ncbi:hypothetical protein BV898_10600 [Hypsibius exemplaris]|uniref:Exocyst complex component EXOC6/Sec15 N-terminal domain-containing protein n=1 Tax=Hypsibius exemplaris TaxID=2072580 RepID=A0A1W0WJ77_HYPEX|nr:hypothetical protein BV898_10600 [Hypsibius exemplaris]
MLSGLQSLPTFVPPTATPSEVAAAEQEHALKVFKLYQARKAHRLDGIFTKAALNDADAHDHDNEESYLIDAVVPFPNDLPALYKILVFRLETDKYFDRLIPFVLRRLNEFGKKEQFVEYIAARIHAREKQIEHVCACNALVLTDSTGDFLNISERADQLRSSVVTVDDREVYETELRNIKLAGASTNTTSKILKNVAILIERISALRPTLKYYEEAQSHARAGRPVKALRKLYKAEASSVHLPRQLSFVKWLATAIPEMKYRLVAAALQGVTRTLENLCNQNAQIGFETIRNICQIKRIFIAPYYVKASARRQSSTEGTADTKESGRRKSLAAGITPDPKDPGRRKSVRVGSLPETKGTARRSSVVAGSIPNAKNTGRRSSVVTEERLIEG